MPGQVKTLVGFHSRLSLGCSQEVSCVRSKVPQEMTTEVRMNPPNKRNRAGSKGTSRPYRGREWWLPRGQASRVKCSVSGQGPTSSGVSRKVCPKEPGVSPRQRPLPLAAPLCWHSLSMGTAFTCNFRKAHFVCTYTKLTHVKILEKKMSLPDLTACFLSSILCHF